MTIGDKIKERRIALGLSQRKLSDKLKITASYFANIERGAQSFPFSRLEEFSKVLGVDLSEYYDDGFSPEARQTKLFLNSKKSVSNVDFWKFVDGLRT